MSDNELSKHIQDTAVDLSILLSCEYDERKLSALKENIATKNSQLKDMQESLLEVRDTIDESAALSRSGFLETSEKLETLYQKIDNLEQFVNMVKDTVDEVTSRVNETQASLQPNALGKVFGRLRVNELKPQLTQDSIFKTNDYLDSTQRSAIVEEFSALLNKFLRKHGLVPSFCQGVAVSGGVDSMAICYLLSQYFGERLHAFTIDHQLRTESTVEAHSVGAVLKRLNIKHDILKIDWKEHGYSEGIPKSQHLETLARKARYSLLGKACHQNQCNTVYFGHHLGDLKETTIFRFARASGIDGLAGISPLTRFPFTDSIPALDLLVARPLLDIPKSRLIDTCKYYGIEWFEDPSNEDLTYQRNLIRHLLKNVDERAKKAREASTHSPLEAFTDIPLKNFAAHMRQHREYVHSQDTMKELAKFDSKNGVCTFTVKNDWLDSTPLATRILSTLIHHVGSKEHPPRLEQILALRQDIANFTHGSTRKSIALGGTLIVSPKDGTSTWTISRQPPKRSELPQLENELSWDTSNLWDNRIFVTLHGNSSHSPLKLFIRPLKNSDREQIRSNVDFERKMKGWFKLVPEPSRFTIPSVTDSQGSLIAIPTLGINLAPELVRFTVTHRNAKAFSSISGV
ncbi:hypothetical protein K493DRAFT_336611 [Basidiobolus meristosporus CBS 931.73]|uniref:tRNA(Ile)-lysidine synthetase n=1 Tax=Basidiobolus meristosporus CBS 931.73 TaxID=1314790 RepID=A0A1Y1YI15_9FUNG|nr:hypothetical protein K493DRAFT_336611 [Basidiobolus meristosporus CBS 931.73]|eukprot:ORX97254.1 hypothetical protein K493DRAFT_336611 [Basidiobolus meristosporus CBS 931.73]